MFQNHVFRARVIGGAVNPYFLSHFLNEFARDHFLTGAKQTTNLASISLSAVKATPILIAPRAEQERIVAAIDNEFTDLDTAEAALGRAREGVEQFRASLLHAACTGALTAAWRDANPPTETGADLLRRILAERRATWERTEHARLTAKGTPPKGDGWKARYVETAAPDFAILPPLPAGWVWTTTEQLSFVTGGLTKNASRGTIERQLPYLRVANVGSAHIDLTKLKTIGVDDGELPRLLLLAGDLLFVEGNGSLDQIGRVAIWRGQISPCVHQNHLIKARPVRESFADWMLLWFMSPLGRQFIQNAASSTSGLHTLSISKIASLPCPLPPPAEIVEVLRTSDDCLGEVSTARQAREGLHDELTNLRQSILHAAFTGRLVPQDPADEPAAALLARLRAAPPPARRTRGRTIR